MHYEPVVHPPRRYPKSVKPAPAPFPWAIVLIGGLVLALAGTAALGIVWWTSPERSPNALAPVVLASEIEGAGPVPVWLGQAPAAVIAAYEWAATNHEALQYIPCHCGDQVPGHASLSDYFYKRSPDGTILSYSDGAVTCQQCLDIARDVRHGLLQGKTLAAIRSDVDRQYQVQGLKATPTPLPPPNK